MRLFLALDLPPPHRRWLTEVRERLARKECGWRLARPESIHLTLRFLGELDRQLAERGGRIWSQVASSVPPFRLTIGGLGTFPPRGRPRILHLGVCQSDSGDALATLASGLEVGARRLGLEPVRRPFRPHLTVARAAREGRSTLPVVRLPAPPGDLFVEQVVLFRSHLEPVGARYTESGKYPLMGSRTGETTA